MLIPKLERDTAAAAIARHDPMDVLGTIAAFQLLPENANALFRLEAAAGVVATLGPVADGTEAPGESALAWVNRPLFSGAADPFNNVFTDEFLFHHGSFTVFPGLREEAFFIVRTLARAVLHTRGDLPTAYFTPAQDLAAATLMVSDAVARRAGLGRGVDPEPEPHHSALLPPGASLPDLKTAVSFTRDELAAILDPLPLEALAPLVQDLPAAVAVDRPASSPLDRPLLRQGDRYVVAAPHALLPALVEACLELARRQGLLEVLAGRYRDAVYSSVLLSAS